MPELQNPEQTDRSDFIDSRRLPDTKGFGSSARSFRAHGRPVASVARGSATRRNRAQSLLRLESVNAWIASCEHPEARADRIRRRPRLRAVEPSRVPVAMQRNDVGPLAGTSGSHD